MPTVRILAAFVVPTVAVAGLIRSAGRQFDGMLPVISGTASLVLALVAASTMQAGTDTGMMALDMSANSFNAGISSPVFIVATLTVMRGIFKFFGE